MNSSASRFVLVVASVALVVALWSVTRPAMPTFATSAPRASWMGTETPPTAEEPPPPPPPPYGLDARVPWTTSTVVGSPEPPPPYRTRQVFEYLAFKEPTVFRLMPGDERYVVAEQHGKIYSFRNVPDVETADVMLDLKTDIRGLEDRTPVTTPGPVYGIAFHPQFAENRYCYVCYVLSVRGQRRPENGTRVSRFVVTETDPPRLDPDSEQVVISWMGGGHNGGCLEFGPDGCLYVSAGDGSFPNPPDELLAGQDVSNLLSSIFRIDVDHPGEGQNYSIPKDNPFVDLPGARGEIWAYGFRNPWKMTFDRKTGDLWAGDVGWELFEMIHFIVRGGNYGWSVVEGTQSVRPEAKRGPTPILPPAIELPHSLAASVTGGYVYHGKQFPELEGQYVFGDWETRRMWAAHWTGKEVDAMRELVDPTLRIVTFAEDPDGELLVVDFDGGTIHAFERNEVPSQAEKFPRKLSQTGLFASTPQHVPAPGVIPFSINSPMWADGATAERFVALPESASVTVHPNETPIAGTIFKRKLEFPANGVLAKTIGVETTVGDPASFRRLETQLLHYDGRQWNGYSYRWNDEQTDADLLGAAGLDATIEIRDPAAPGGRRTLAWHFPGRAECARCHNPWAQQTLAFNLPQLNRDRDYEGVVDNQLRTLSHVGVLKGLAAPDERGNIDGAALAKKQPRLADPHDESAPLDLRARAYLHANCAHCHQMGAGGTADIELRAHVSLAETKTIGKRPMQGTFEIPEAAILSPGDPFRSVLYYRLSKVGRGRMPHIGSEVVDRSGIALIHEWIRRLPTRLDDDLLLDQLAKFDEDAAMQAEQAGEKGRVAKIAASLAKQAEREKPSDEDRTKAAETDRQQVQSRKDKRTADRNALFDQYFGDPSRALMLAERVRWNTLPESTRTMVVAAGAARPEPQIRDLFEEFLFPEQRTKRLRSVVKPDEILALVGDSNLGREQFHKTAGVTCRNCHRVGPEGKQVGPELTKIGGKLDRRQLLTSILDPSQKIDPPFLTYLVETTAGRVHTGLLIEQTPEHVTLRDAGGKDLRIATKDVEQLVPQRQSLMPELLARDLTAQQLADLLAYLESLR